MAIYTNQSGYLESNSAHSNSTFTACFWARVISPVGLSTFYALNGNLRPLVGLDFPGTSWELGDQQTGYGGSIAVNNGVWQHIAWSKNAGTSSLYVDAVFSASTAAQGDGAGSTFIRLFRYGGGGAPETPNGEMAYLKVWDGVALTQSEIARERLFAKPQKLDGLWAWLPMLEANRNANLIGNGVTFTEFPTLSTVDNPPISWGDSPIIYPYAAPSPIYFNSPRMLLAC